MLAIHENHVVSDFDSVGQDVDRLRKSSDDRNWLVLVVIVCQGSIRLFYRKKLDYLCSILTTYLIEIFAESLN